jgi:hypothetical protein
MGFGLVILGLCLGGFAAGVTLWLGAGLLWAAFVYALGGVVGVFAGAMLVFWRAERDTTCASDIPTSKPQPLSTGG